MHEAAGYNSKECMELLLSYGAEVNAKKNVSNYNTMKVMIIIFGNIMIMMITSGWILSTA